MSNVMPNNSFGTVSWSNLSGVFDNKELQLFFENLETKYHVKNEVNFFAQLVNMSTACKKPFHRWIRYREGYSGELVREILKRYPISPQKHFVMDPMCGSGSSLVACGDLGIDAIGLDVNGYAVLTTNVKCHSFTQVELSLILDSIGQLRRGISFNECDKSTPTNDIRKYFPEDNFNKLLSIKEWISTAFNKGIVADFFNVALLAILEDCSNRKKDGNGLATRPAPVSDVLERLLSQLTLMLEDVSVKSISKSHRKAFDSSALQLENSSKQFAATTRKELGLIIFSPPYANSFDYFESYKLELVFGDFIKVSELNDSRQRLIRNYRITAPKKTIISVHPVELLCSEIMTRIPTKEAETGTRDGRTRLVPNMLRGYFEDMRTVIQEGYNSLCADGTMHIVVDQSAYVGVPIATDLIFALLAEKIGFDVVSVKNCRRANTSGQQLKKFPYLKNLLRESIVSLRKPSHRA